MGELEEITSPASSTGFQCACYKNTIRKKIFKECMSWKQSDNKCEKCRLASKLKYTSDCLSNVVAARDRRDRDVTVTS